MEKFMSRSQIKKMFIYMGYDIDALYYMSLSNMGKYWKIDYVERDMKLKSYFEFKKTGNDLEDRKEYIEYYKRTKKVNEFRAKARMYNAYCASHFIEKKMVSDISASDLYDAVMENKNKVDELQAKFDNNEISFNELENELDNIGTIGYNIKEYRNGMGINGFDLFSACAYASGDSKLDVSKKKAAFVRVVNALHNWYVNYYLKNEAQMNYYN